MADDTRSLDVLIRTKAELSGAKAVEEQLERDIGKAKALGKSHEDLSQQLASVKGSIAAAKSANKDLDDEGEKGTERFGLKARELKKIVHELGHEFPIAGMAARAFLNPIGVAATLAIGVFAKVKEKIAELNAKLDEMAAIGAKPIGDMAGAMQEAAQGVAAGAAEFKSHLEDLVHVEQTLSEKTNAAVEALRAQERAFLELTDAREALALAMVDAAEKEHKADATKGINSTQATKDRTAIREYYDRNRREAKDAGDKNAVQLKQDELARRRAMEAALLKQAEDTQAKLNDKQRLAHAKVVAKTPADIDEMMAQKQKELAEAQKKVDAAAELRNEMSFPGASAFVPGGAREGLDKQYDRSIEERDQKQRELELLRAEKKKFEERSAQDVGTQKGLEHGASDALRKLDENTNAINKLTEEIGRMKEDAALGKRTRDNLGTIHTLTRAVNDVGTTVDEDAEERQRQTLLNRPGTVSTASASTAQAAKQITAPTDAVLDILEVLVPGIKDQQRRVSALETQVQNMNTRSNSSRVP